MTMTIPYHTVCDRRRIASYIPKVLNLKVQQAACPLLVTLLLSLVGTPWLFQIFRFQWLVLRSKDDRGIDGVIVIPDVNKKRVRIGTKMSTESVRQSQHESGTARDEAYQKQSKKLDLQVNEQACGRLIFPFTVPSLPSPIYNIYIYIYIYLYVFYFYYII